MLKFPHFPLSKKNKLFVEIRNSTLKHTIKEQLIVFEVFWREELSLEEFGCNSKGKWVDVGFEQE